MSFSVDLAQIRPVTDFVRNYKSYLNRIKETRRPEVLTVNGVAEFVLIDAKTYQEMKDVWEEARFITAVNEGVASMNSGTGKPNGQAFQEIRASLGL